MSARVFRKCSAGVFLLLFDVFAPSDGRPASAPARTSTARSRCAGSDMRDEVPACCSMLRSHASIIFWYLLSGTLPLRHNLGERSTAPTPIALLPALLDRGAEPFESGVLRCAACALVPAWLEDLALDRTGSCAPLFVSTLSAAMGDVELRRRVEPTTSTPTLSRLRTALGTSVCERKCSWQVRGLHVCWCVCEERGEARSCVLDDVRELPLVALRPDSRVRGEGERILRRASSGRSSFDGWRSLICSFVAAFEFLLALLTCTGERRVAPSLSALPSLYHFRLPRIVGDMRARWSGPGERRSALPVGLGRVVSDRADTISGDSGIRDLSLKNISTFYSILKSTKFLWKTNKPGVAVAAQGTLTILQDLADVDG